MIEKIKTNQNLWDLFTRKKEYSNFIPDKHDRFPADEEIKEPVINQFLLENSISWDFPNGKDFAVCLTHDIDCINAQPRLKMAREALKALGKLKCKDFCRYMLLALQVHRWPVSAAFKEKINPLFNFNQVMALEKKYDAKSSFYFLALEKDEKDFDYKLEELKEIFTKIKAGGWEIGLHGGYDAYKNSCEIKTQKERLEKNIGQPVSGYRNHYLRFSVPETWENLAENGFLYDTTFGFGEKPGFRNGLCLPFKPYNLKTERLIDLWELPLGVMDTTLFNHLKMSKTQALETFKKFIDLAAKNKGVLTLLWHNSYLTPEYIDVYEEILSYIQEKNGWMVSGREIAEWASSQKELE